MANMTLDLNLLVVFDAVMRHRSATRAAAELGVTQPAVSWALRRLRHHYKDQLLIRRAGGLEPTTRALKIAEPIAEALKCVQATLGTKFDPKQIGRTFRIGIVQTDASYLLTALKTILARETAGADVVAVPLSSESAEGSLLSFEVDFVIGAVQPARKHVRKTTLRVDRFVMITRKARVTVNGSVSKATLASLQFIRFDPIDDRIEPDFRRAGIRRQFAVRATQLGFVPLIVARSDLAAVIPAGLADLYRPFCDLAIRDVSIALPADRTELLWHDHSTPDVAHGWLRRTIVAASKHLEEQARSRSFGALAML